MENEEEKLYTEKERRHWQRMYLKFYHEKCEHEAAIAAFLIMKNPDLLEEFIDFYRKLS